MTSYNYQLENHLRQITQTYCNNEATNKATCTTVLHYNYHNAYKKSARRIQIILHQINHKKKGVVKTYQIRGYYEYKIVKKYCMEQNIKHELITNNQVLTNKVVQIKQYVSDYDYENNLCKLVVENEKLPTMYIKV